MTSCPAESSLPDRLTPVRRSRPERPDQAGLDTLLARPSGVGTRQQMLDLGFSDSQIRTLVRGRWQTMHAGVHLFHNGTPTRLQREWAACLAAWPAALARASALPQLRLLSPNDPIHVTVRSGRRARRLR